MGTVIRRKGCPKCGALYFTALMHYDCPPGSTPDDYVYLVCENPDCLHEFSVSALVA